MLPMCLVSANRNAYCLNITDEQKIQEKENENLSNTCDSDGDTKLKL